jgi:hypothetical protein
MGVTTPQAPPGADPLVSAPRARPRADGLAATLSAWLLPVAVAAAVFLVALDGGGFSTTSRLSLTVGVAWALGVGVALGLWPAARSSRTAVVAAVLLALLAALAGASIAWSDAAERSFLELNRVLLYLGVFCLVLVVSRPASLQRWIDGLALGLTAVVVLALVNRLLPGVVGPEEISAYYRGDPRPSYPVNYWNGLGVLTALAVPLLAQIATSSRAKAVRGLALAPLPAIAALLYLTSSRGGAVTLLAATLALVALTNRRALTLGALALGGVAGVLAVRVLSGRHELVDGPLNTATSNAQGRSAAALVLLLCALTGVGWALLSRLHVPALPTPGRRLKAVAAVAAIAAVAALAVAADPAARLDSFRQPPAQATQVDRNQGFSATPSDPAEAGGGYTGSHLLSGGSSGRWQFWGAAVDAFEAQPLHGTGAGTYEAWWAEHGSISYFNRYAHSLYLQTLGELGILGFLALAGFFAAVAVGTGRRLREATGARRAEIAAVAALFAGFAAAAALDWMWELPVVAGLGVAAAALLLGPASDSASAADSASNSAPGANRAPRIPRAARVAAVAAAAGVVVAAGIPLLANTDVAASRQAAAAGNVGAAREHAQDARRWQPWAASPYLQLALVEEQAGDPERARGWIAQAIDREPGSWRLWLAASRIELATGRPAAARASYAHARRLNPRSPIFQ